MGLIDNLKFLLCIFLKIMQEICIPFVIVFKLVS